MAGLSKKLLVGIVIPFFFLAVFSTSSFAQDDEDIPENIPAYAMVWDALLARPLGLVSICVGSVVFGISWPFAALGGNDRITFEKLIAEPVSFTFDRGLGDF